MHDDALRLARWYLPHPHIERISYVANALATEERLASHELVLEPTHAPREPSARDSSAALEIESPTACMHPSTQDATSPKTAPLVDSDVPASAPSLQAPAVPPILAPSAALQPQLAPRKPMAPTVTTPDRAPAQPRTHDTTSPETASRAASSGPTRPPSLQAPGSLPQYAPPVALQYQVALREPASTVATMTERMPGQTTCQDEPMPTMAPCIAPGDPAATPSIQERAMSHTSVQSAALPPQLAPREPSTPKAATTTLEPERPRCRINDKSIPSQVQRFRSSIHDHGDDDHEYCFGGVNSYAPNPGRPPDVRLQPQMVALEACSADPYYSIGFNDGRYEAGVHAGLYGVDGDERGLRGCDKDGEYDDGGGYADDDDQYFDDDGYESYYDEQYDQYEDEY